MIHTGFWDIETTDLKANMGRVLVSCVKDMISGQVISLRADSYEWFADDVSNDKDLLIDIVKVLDNVRFLVTWNGKLFDRKFLNARCMAAGVVPPRPVFHIDLYQVWKTHCRSYGSLDAVQRLLKTETPKTPLDWRTWQNAAALKKNALDDVETHCVADVEALSEVYQRMLHADLIKTCPKGF
jgi:uncharacterized protein YprB with RNaseH-like and TPR domain